MHLERTRLLAPGIGTGQPGAPLLAARAPMVPDADHSLNSPGPLCSSTAFQEAQRKLDSLRIPN